MLPTYIMLLTNVTPVHLIKKCSLYPITLKEGKFWISKHLIRRPKSQLSEGPFLGHRPLMCPHVAEGARELLGVSVIVQGH